MAGVYAFARRATPGKLVAKDQFLTWRSPDEGPFRLLALDAAQATFHLENVGGSPVRILDVKTTCGCTTPKIDLMVIAPGQVASMEVRANPLQTGEKDVNISVTTDSSTEPTVVVRLHILGSRKPPYMSDARGDLNFSGDLKPGDARSFVVDCSELSSSRPTPPIVKNDLAFIELSVPTLEKEQPTIAPDVVNRRWVIEARLKSTTAGNDSGQITVIDPWDPNHFQALTVHREVAPPLRVSPQRAILTAGTAGAAVRPTAKFVITSREPIADLILEWEDGAVVPLGFSAPTTGADKRTFFFSVTLNSPAESGKIYHLRIGRSSSSDRISVPIAIRIEAPR